MRSFGGLEVLTLSTSGISKDAMVLSMGLTPDGKFSMLASRSIEGYRETSNEDWHNTGNLFRESRSRLYESVTSCDKKKKRIRVSS